MDVTKIPKKTISVIEPKRSLIVNREQYHQRRVAAYCRVSTDSEEQITSYTNQKKVYTEMIAATIVHQMIECVKVYPDGRLDIIFGGGYLIEERLEKES